MNRNTIAILTASAFLLSLQSTRAGSATWNPNPTNGDWNTAANWAPATIPNGPSDIATFGISGRSDILLSQTAEVSGLVYDSGATPYTINTSLLILTISGTGITNISGIDQNFVSGNYGGVFFTGNATAGSQTIFSNVGSTNGQGQPGVTNFYDSASADHGTFINRAADVVTGPSGQTTFFDRATAGNGTFVCYGSAVAKAPAGGVIFTQGTSAAKGSFTVYGGTVREGAGGYVSFYSSLAGAGTFFVNGGTAKGAVGGYVVFGSGSSAEDSTFVVNGGKEGGKGGNVYFSGSGQGGRARLELRDNGTLDVTDHNHPTVTVGSIEGNGFIDLGRHSLAVGSNGLNTTFRGVIRDAGGGSFTKAGSGKLVLTNASTYKAGTTVEEGQLVINNDTGSGTGTGPVLVTGGRLVGRGIIGGGVTVGTGTAHEAILSPGRSDTTVGLLTIQGALSFNSDGSYSFQLDSDSATADSVSANGLTINNGALFSATGLGTGTLTPGTTFAVISNTAATPIAGTFANLGQGTSVLIGNNTFQANYGGGDGNDLTLTVVP